MENQKNVQARVNEEKAVGKQETEAQQKKTVAQESTGRQQKQEAARKRPANPKKAARVPEKKEIEVDMCAPMGECARNWVKAHGEQAEHNVFIKRELDRQYNALHKRLSDSFTNFGGIGAVAVNFARIYCKIAETVFKKFGKKYLPDEFNTYWNARFAAESRIGTRPGGVSVHVVSSKASSRAVQTNLGWLNDFIIPSNGKGNNGFQTWFNGSLRNIAIVDDCGEGIVYWNDNALLDHDFVRVYLKRYFNTAVLQPFFEALKFEAEESEYATYNVEWFAYSFPETIFDTDLQVKAIKFWSGITNEGIFRQFAEFAAQENLTITPYPEVGILIGVGENLHAREVH